MNPACARSAAKRSGKAHRIPEAGNSTSGEPRPSGIAPTAMWGFHNRDTLVRTEMMQYDSPAGRAVQTCVVLHIRNRVKKGHHNGDGCFQIS